MIADVDASLRALLSQAIVDEDATVSFDAPSSKWAEARKGAVLNLFLYDVREDLDGRKADWDDVRDPVSGRVVSRQPPPRRYTLSYFASAWAASAEEEHHLLSEVIATVPQREIIPPEFLQGSLAAQEMPVVIQLGVPGQGAGIRSGEMWAALGVPPRAAMELVVTAPYIPPVVTDIAPAAEQMALGLSRERGGPRMHPPTGSLEERVAREDTPEALAKQADDEAAPGAGVPGLPRGKRWAGFRIVERRETVERREAVERDEGE